jgi:hypothetical protein
MEITSSQHKLPVWSKIKTVGKTGVIPSRRGLAACRPLRFFGAINGALCGSADKWGETHAGARILAYITGRWTRSCCCGMSIWLLKTGSWGAN